MKKTAMWMVMLAMVVSPLFAQEGEPSEPTEQQQPTVTEESAGQAQEQPAETQEQPAAVEEQSTESEEQPVQTQEQPALTEEQQVEQAIDEALGITSETETVGFEEETVGFEEEIVAIEEEPLVEAVQEPEKKQKSQYREVQTLMKGGGGGYGALSFGYSQINQLNALQFGAQAEWVMGHGFGLGISGVGFTSDFTPVGTDYYALSGGYGGLVMEPILFGWFPVHIALPVMIGGGGIASYTTNSDPWDYDNFNPTFGENAWFFVAEVGVELEFNLVRFFRLSLFGTYRWTTDLNMQPMYGLDPISPYPVDPHALHGWTTGMRFKFGSF